MATSGSGTSTPAVSIVGSYTLAQVVSRARQRLDDTLEPYLWSNDELTDYIDKLQKQLAAEMNLFEDRTTADICSIDLVQNDGLISLSPRILAVTRAMLVGETAPLTFVTSEFMDSVYPGWMDAGAPTGTPTLMVTQGLGPDQAFLFPLLEDATGTLKLTVFRLPLLDLDYSSHSGTALECDKFAHLLIHGIMWQAYLKQDSDTYDPQRAEKSRVLWEGQNGKGGDKEQIRRMVIRRHYEPQSASPMAAFM